MVKSDIAKKVAQETGLNHRDALQVVESVIATCKKGISNDGVLKIPNFGTFTRVKRKPKKGRNITRNKVMVIPARYRVSFIASTALKKAVL